MQTLKPRVQRITNPLARKPSQTAGYRIRGRKLQRIRKAHLSANPLCVRCLAEGRVEPAVEVDHILALENGGKDVPDNRQGLCLACHKEKSDEDNGRGGSKPRKTF